MIVLDEPTNDLDAETLELLEDRLVEFPGTLLLVSHDREFLNNVVTSTIVFDAGEVREFVGGYDDWLRQRGDPPAVVSAANPPPAKGAFPPQATESSPAKRRLGYQEKRELESLPSKIDSLTAKVAVLHEEMAQPEFYKLPSTDIARKQAQLKELDRQLATAYQRWEELEPLAN